MVAYSPHPLSSLSTEETSLARRIILAGSPDDHIQFRMIYRQEPAKAELVPFLDLEHSGQLTSTSSRPPRLARVHYVTPCKSMMRQANEVEATVDLNLRKVISKDVVSTEYLAGLST